MSQENNRDSRLEEGFDLRRLSKSIIAACLALSTSAALASNVTAPSVAVTGITTYAGYGGGDVIFTLYQNANLGACASFWIRASDAGAGKILGQIQAAYMTSKPVVVTVDISQYWPGNAGAYACLVYSVSY